MGKIFALCGASGVGKTTFLEALAATQPQRLRFLQRATSRERRPGEGDFEYDFYSEEGFLQKVFAGDVIFPEVFDGAFYGVDKIPIADTLNSDEDGIVMAGIFAATRLKAMYSDKVDVLYMHTAERNSLLSPQGLKEDFPATNLLRTRLLRKMAAGQFGTETEESLERIGGRMRLNLLNISFVNGEMRREAYKIQILPNLENEMSKTVEHFLKHRKADVAASNLRRRADEL